MARLRSRSACLPEPLTLSPVDRQRLEKAVKKPISKNALTRIEAAINGYREAAALQVAAPKVRDVVGSLETFRTQALELLKTAKRLNARSNSIVTEAADLIDASVALREKRDREVEALADFVLRLDAMADLAGARITDLREAYQGRRGVEPDNALDNLIAQLIPIAKQLKLRVTAHYSQAAGGRTGPFVSLVKAATAIARGGKAAAGLDERCARVLKGIRGRGRSTGSQAARSRRSK